MTTLLFNGLGLFRIAPTLGSKAALAILRSIVMVIVGSVGLAYVSGEWHGVKGNPLTQMRMAVVILSTAAIIMAYGKALSST